MDGLLDVLRDGLVRCDAVGRRLGVGVSGGADSVALLLGLCEVRETFDLELVVLHLDHRLRSTSTADAGWVESLANDLETECRIGVVDVRRLASERNVGFEEAARDARYAFFADAAEVEHCDGVAVAHTADDQAETVLHHLLRGTGLPGLRGMPLTRPLANGVPLVRPLLKATRSQVERYLAERGRSHLEDETNASSEFTRNRIRTELLPLLERDFNPNVRAALRRLAWQAAEVTEIVDEQAAALLHAAIRQSNDDESSATAEGRDGHEVVRIGIAPFATASDHLVRAAFVELWRRRNWPRRGMGFVDWQRLVDIIREGGAASLHGGIDARRRNEQIVLRRT